MTPDSLRALIAAGESLALEFKSDERTPFNDRDLVEAVVCLANRTGREVAHLIIGVEDDGRHQWRAPAPRGRDRCSQSRGDDRSSNAPTDCRER